MEGAVGIACLLVAIYVTVSPVEKREEPLLLTIWLRQRRRHLWLIASGTFFSICVADWTWLIFR